MSGLLQTAEIARAFALAGNATLTLVSKATSQRFTYKIKVCENDAQLFFVSYLYGPENDTNFAYLGLIRREVYFHGGTKAREWEGAPVAKAFAWAWRQLVQDKMPSTLEVWHEGRCGRCNRKLTVPSSIASGFGPECAARGPAVVRRFFAEAS